MENTTIQMTPANMAERKKLDIRPGDTVKVHLKIEEKGKTRIQVFEGLVLAVKHGKEMGGTFTVRKVISGVGVEKIFPIYSPTIDTIEVVKRSKVRRAKLYYIREKVAREIRRKMRRMMNAPVVEEIAPEEKKKEETPVDVEAEKVEKAEEGKSDAAPEEKENAAEEKKEVVAEAPEEKAEEAVTPEKKEEK